MWSKRNKVLGRAWTVRSSCGFSLRKSYGALFALFLTSCHHGGLTLSDVAPAASPLQSSTVAFPRKPQTGEAWWHALNDTQLNEIMSRVQQGNLTVAQARERLAAATAIAHSAASDFRPNAVLSGQATASTSKVRVDDFSRRPAQLNLETSWEIALFGQDNMAQTSADMDAAIAAEDVDAARLSVVAEAATSYVRLRALQQERKDADLRASAQTRTRALSEIKFRSGLGTRLEAQSATDDSSAAAQQKRVLDSAIADEIQRIAFLEGVTGGDAGLSEIKPQPQARGAAAMEVPADLLRQRADVRRAEFAMLKAGAEVGIAKADLYPKLHLSGMIGFGSPVSGSLFGVMGGPSLQLPLFDYGKRLDTVEAKKAQLQEATAAYRQAVLLAYGEASTALRAFQIARQDTARVKSAYATTEQVKAAAELLSREGLADASKVIENQLVLVERHRQLTEALKNEAEAMIAFARATGGSLGYGKTPRAQSTEQKRKK